MSDLKLSNICAKLSPPLEVADLVASENNFNSDMLKYLDNEQFRGLYHINNIYGIKRTKNQ